MIRYFSCILRLLLENQSNAYPSSIDCGTRVLHFLLLMKALLCTSCNKSIFDQIEALKAIGVTEVILAINYQPKVRLDLIV